MKLLRQNLSIIGCALLLTVLICAGFLRYAEWELKRFNASLPEVPTVDTPASSEWAQQERTQTAALSVSETSRGIAESDNTETDAASLVEIAAVTEEPPSEPIDEAHTLFPEETDWDLLESEDFMENEQEVPYDMAKVQAGFDDYNAYLATDPAYAYQRLDEAFREQYGDSPDVNILVETFRRFDDGTATIDDAIDNASAFVRLMHNLVTPEGIQLVAPEGIQIVADHLEFLLEIKQLALEEGATIRLNYRARN